jgi:hypothetical protein
MILIVLVYRDRIERWFRMIHVAQRLRSMKEKRKLRHRKRDMGK